MYKLEKMENKKIGSACFIVYSAYFIHAGLVFFGTGTNFIRAWTTFSDGPSTGKIWLNWHR